jgi:DNA polymerase III epsilon subunit-like protein
LRDAPTDALAERYATFLGENVSFKELCGRWQLRDGRHNDHADPRYDAEVLAELGDLHDRAAPVVADFGELFERMRPYQARLSTVLDRLRSGETGLFTGVMCGSYHDVWMELHEDLILTQRVDRAADGGD